MATTNGVRKSSKSLSANSQNILRNNGDLEANGGFTNLPNTAVKPRVNDLPMFSTVRIAPYDKTARIFSSVDNGEAGNGFHENTRRRNSNYSGNALSNADTKTFHKVRTVSSSSISSKNQDTELAQINSQSEDRLAQVVRMVKLLAAVVLPSTAAIILGVIYMTSAVSEISRINKIAAQIDISHKFGSLVTCLQKERGSSTIYVATATEAAAKLATARANMMIARACVDKQFEAISAETDWRWTTEDPVTMRTKTEFLAALKDHRKSVIPSFANDSGAANTTSLEQIDWYSDVDSKFLAWVTRGFQDFLVVPVVDYKLVLTAKDSTGIVRALGGTYWTQGGFTSGQYARFVKAFTNGEALLQQATDLSSDLLRVYVKKREEQLALVNRLDAWREPIIANNSSLRPDGIQGQEWFGNMTTYIDLVIGALEATTLEQTEALVAAQWKSAVSSLVIAIVLVAPVVILGPPLIIWYQYEVGQINKKILTFAKNVAAKSSLLAQEKKKSELLLYQMIPKSVADALKQGKTVPAQAYDLVTIMFTDIVSFTDIAAMCTPLQVVELLNTLYTEFDAAIEMHDVYKVETIGDAYMCASGLPTTNGDQHAGEIANLALNLLEVTDGIQLPVIKGRRLLLRVGAHTGPVVAGVVGTKMPRYCLFGDTVNTASRMESTAEALTVQVSESCANLLRKSKDKFELSGPQSVAVKGKGVITTYLVLRSKRCNYVVDVEEARRITEKNIFKSKDGSAGFKDMYK